MTKFTITINRKPKTKSDKAISQICKFVVEDYKDTVQPLLRIRSMQSLCDSIFCLFLSWCTLEGKDFSAYVIQRRTLPSGNEVIYINRTNSTDCAQILIEEEEEVGNG